MISSRRVTLRDQVPWPAGPHHLQPRFATGAGPGRRLPFQLIVA